jgi:hypothetical protein
VLALALALRAFHNAMVPFQNTAFPEQIPESKAIILLEIFKMFPKVIFIY